MQNSHEALIGKIGGFVAAIAIASFAVWVIDHYLRYEPKPERTPEVMPDQGLFTDVQET